jgi:hypothetical protein
MTLISFQNGSAVIREGKVGTDQECCCDCWKETVLPLTVTISNFALQPGYVGGEGCNCYEGTHTIEEMDTVYTTAVCPPDPDFTDAFVAVRAFNVYNGALAEVCYGYTYLGVLWERCCYFFIGKSDTTGLFACKINFEGCIINQAAWTGCVGTIEVDFA